MSSVVVRPTLFGEVGAAAQIVHDGSLSPDAEHPERVDDYWAAVVETRERGGEVLVASDGDEVVGVCQVLVFRHFQHTGAWCAEIESVHVHADRRSEGIGAMMLKSADVFATDRGCQLVSQHHAMVSNDESS